MCRVLLAAACAAASFTAIAAENAGDFPSRPLRMVVGFSPVGGADVVTRMYTYHVPTGIETVTDADPDASVPVPHCVSDATEARPDAAA